MTTMATTKIRTALSTVVSGMVRPRTWVFSRPSRRLNPKSPITAAVVTFTPPPQLPGFAPMNMMTIKKNRELAHSPGTSTVLSPAVRLVKAMNRVDSNFCPTLRSPRVLFHSVSENTSTLAATTNRVPKVAMRVWSEIFRTLRCLKSNTYCSSVTAKKPNPPARASTQVERFTRGFSWNCTRESGNRVKPTLQKELTAWNTETNMRS